MPEGPDAALKCFQEYKKSMNWSRWVYGLTVASSRPSFKIPFIKQSVSKQKKEPLKWGKALIIIAARTGPSCSARTKLPSQVNGPYLVVAILMGSCTEKAGTRASVLI